MAKITHGEEYKKVEVCFGDSLLRDTAFTVAPNIPDSTILVQLRHIEDSLRIEALIADSIRKVFVRDSLYKEFQQDLINFRRITKKINGGYNGWNERYKEWLNNRRIFESEKNE